ncbi:MAG: DUF4367 domain-containing protein [Desulfitobacteriaceae bacterium]|nr:DUF4367 domain-containing protein [Desulfitobacteriaceae bacterium]
MTVTTDRLLEKFRFFEVPESLNKGFYDYLKKYNRKVHREKFIKKASLISKRIAAIIIVIFIVSAVLPMCVEAYRIHFFNMIIETSKQFSSVKLEKNYNTDYLDELPSEWNDYYYPTILPEGYNLKNAFDANGTIYIIFSDHKNNELRFVQGSVTADFQLDSEKGQIFEININGMKGLIIEKDSLNIINWHNNNKNFYIQGNLDKSILLKVVESIERNH